MLALATLVVLAGNAAVTAALSRRWSLAGAVADMLALTGFLAFGAMIVGSASLIGPAIGTVVGGAIIFFVVVLYVSSLNFLHVTGHCLDLAALRMILVNARLGFLHEASYSPWRAAVSLAAMLAITAALTWLLAVALGIDGVGASDVAVAAALALASLAAFAVLVRTTSIARCRAGGPFVTLIADAIAARRFDAAAAESVVEPVIRAEQPLPLLRRPDLVILVIVDSFRTTLMGHDVVSARWMPRVFARSGKASIFHKHRCNAVMSEFSDISLLAGDLRWRSYFHGMPGPEPRNRTLHQWFRAAGYATAHVSAQDERWSRMDLWYRDGVDALMHAGGGCWPAGLTSSANARVLGGAKLRDEVVIGAAGDLLARRSGPTFMTINLQSTHVPFFYPASRDLPWPDIDHDARIRFGGLDEATIAVALQKYANALHHVDALLADLIDSLAGPLATGNAALWITGDTGQAFGEHGYSGHGAGLQDSLLHTPLLIFGDDRFADATGERTDHLQIHGSLAAYARAGGGRQIGTSGAVARPMPLVCQTPMANELGVVVDDRKLVLDCRTLDVSRFDLARDPDERDGVRLPADEAAAARGTILAEIRRAVHEAREAGVTPPSVPSGATVVSAA